MAGIVENKWLTKSTLSPRLASMTAATVMAAMSSPTSPPRYRHSSWSSRPLTPGSVVSIKQSLIDSINATKCRPPPPPTTLHRRENQDSAIFVLIFKSHWQVTKQQKSRFFKKFFFACWWKDPGGPKTYWNGSRFVTCFKPRLLDYCTVDYYSS